MGKKQQKEPEYVLEKIINHRVTKQTQGSVTFQSIEIYVKWEGYAASHNTWEPLTCIYFDIRALTRRYFREKGFELNCKFQFVIHAMLRRHECSACKKVYFSAFGSGWDKKEWSEASTKQTSGD